MMIRCGIYEIGIKFLCVNFCCTEIIYIIILLLLLLLFDCCYFFAFGLAVF